MMKMRLYHVSCDVLTGIYLYISRFAIVQVCHRDFARIPLIYCKEYFALIVFNVCFYMLCGHIDIELLFMFVVALWHGRFRFESGVAFSSCSMLVI